LTRPIASYGNQSIKQPFLKLCETGRFTIFLHKFCLKHFNNGGTFENICVGEDIKRIACWKMKVTVCVVFGPVFSQLT